MENRKQHHFNSSAQYLESYTQALKRVDSSAQRASLYHRRGQVYQLIGNNDEAVADFKRAHRIAKRIGNRETEAEAILSLSRISLHEGNYAKTDQLARTVLSIGEEIGKPRLVAGGLLSLGAVSTRRGDYPEAQQFYEEALEIYRALDDRLGITKSLHNMAVVVSEQGAYENAKQLYTETLKLKREIGDVVSIAASLCNLAGVIAHMGDYDLNFARIRRNLGYYPRH